MELDFNELIKILAVFQAVLFALYLLIDQNGRKFSNFFIALFLILLVLNLTQHYINTYVFPNYDVVGLLLVLSAYVIAPTLYLYIRTSADPHFKFTWKSGLHLLPVVVLAILFLDSFPDDDLETDLIPADTGRLSNIIAYITFYLQNFIYLILSFGVLKRLKQLYKEAFSNTDIRRFNYLFQLNSIIFVLFVFSAIKNFMVFNVTGDYIDYAIHLVLFSLLIFFCWIIIKGLQSPELFRKSETQMKAVKDLIKEDAHILANAQTQGGTNAMDTETDNMVKKVTNYMEQNEAYLDASLSLHDLSRQTGIGSRELSLLINHHLNKHFFDFVNEYRIDKAKEILNDPGSKELTILEILYDVGFNSKSSFNTAFKKHTGKTPTQYRLSSINQ